MYLYNKVCCINCQQEISIKQLTNHFKSKSCTTYDAKAIKGICRHCNQDISNLPPKQIANHARWCHKNPKHESYTHNLKHARSQINSETYRRIGQKVSDAHKSGAYDSAPTKMIATKKKNGTLDHTEETKELLRIKALNSKHQRVCKSSHTYIDKRGRSFIFDSKWEDALADRLDELNLYWTRPEPIKYMMNDRLRNYFPDFYLPYYDLYLDPKNDWVMKQQSEKIKIVSELINLKIISTLEECKTFMIK